MHLTCYPAPVRLFAVIIGVSMIACLPHALAVRAVRKVVMHLHDNDPDRMNLMLNNAANTSKYYREQGEGG